MLVVAALGSCLLLSCGRESGKAGGKAVSAAPASGPVVHEIQAAEFDAFRKQTGVVAIVDFHAPWCGPCRELGPLLEEIANEHAGAVQVAKVNVDDNPELAAREGVSGIPDLRIHIDGRVVDKFVGVPPADHLRRRIDAHVQTLGDAKPDSSWQAPQAVAETPDARPASIEPMPENWMPPGMERRNPKGNAGGPDNPAPSPSPPHR